MFDREVLARAVAAQGAVARVVIAAHDGSSPREVGAAMLVWPGGQEGTIGGGALEHEAARAALAALARGAGRLERVALGPALGQCCGGRVTVLTEIFDAARLPPATEPVFARAVEDRPMPLAVKRLLAAARGEGVLPHPAFLQGWMVEPLARPERQIWVWGAGHVGRALVSVLAPLPGFAVTWVDVAPDRFPETLPPGVLPRIAPAPEGLMDKAPVAAEHLIVTFSHALDLALCHAALRRGFAGCGLIGSATKWARFRSRLAALGHAPGAVARIDCPIGDPGLGKHPQAIAIGVAAALLRRKTNASRQENAG